MMPHQFARWKKQALQLLLQHGLTAWKWLLHSGLVAVFLLTFRLIEGVCHLLWPDGLKFFDMLELRYVIHAMDLFVICVAAYDAGLQLIRQTRRHDD